MDEQEIRDLEETFGTNGWRRIVSDAEAAIRDREAAALQARNFEEVCFLKGEAAQLYYIVNLQRAIEMAKAQAEEEEE